MKKLLFIVNIPSPYRVDFFNELGRKDGIALTVVFLVRPDENNGRERSWFREEYQDFRAVFCKDPIRLPGGKKLYPKIREELKKPWDEIIFGGYVYPTMLYAMRWLKRHRRPYSIEIDGGLLGPEKALRRKIKTLVISSADKWYSSGPVSDKYLLHYGAGKERILHYPFSSVKQEDCIDEALLDPREKERLREQLGMEEQRILISVGQFIHRKGFDLLLEAARSLPKSLGIYIIGGEPPESYRKMAAEYKLTNVHFVSFMQKQALLKYYRAADLFVLPTREDIWGLVINEAMACGLPVVTTDRCVAGMEMIEEGKNGFIVKANDAAALQQGIAKALQANLLELGRESLKTAKRYTIEKMAEAHERFLKDDFSC